MSKTKSAKQAIKTENKSSESMQTSMSDKTALLLSGLAALGYYLYSFKSTGYYQHDEIGHLLNMYEFWENPASILGNWAKTGYKLVYALPVLLGGKFVLMLNCLLAGLSCFIAFKTTKLFTPVYAPLALLLLATQPMWIELSFRNYADSFSGLVLISAIYFFYKNRLIPAVLLLSFSTLVRQEFYLIAIPFGVYLLLKQKWAPAFLLALFPLLYNFFGALHTGDPLYLYTSTVETSELYSDQFGKHGFFHFFRMSMVVWGSVSVILAVVFAAQYFMRLINPERLFNQNPVFLLIPALIYLFIHSLFNYEGLNLAASPNLRYMNAIGPILAVLATLGLAWWPNFKSKPLPIVIVAGAALLFYLAYSTYEHTGIVLTEERDYKLWFIAVLAFGLLFLNLKPKTGIVCFGILSFISGSLALQPKVPSSEDITINEMVNWIIKNNKDEKMIFTNHTVVPYYYQMSEGRLPVYHGLDSSMIANAEVGSIVILESHYSLRKDFPPPSEKILNEYLESRDFNKALNSFMVEQEGRYQVVNRQFMAKDRRFGAFIFEKVK